MIGLVLLIPALQPEPAPPELPQPERERRKIVITATRTETPKGSLGSSVSVIDREEIELWSRASAYGYIRNLHGLEVVRTSGPGSVTTVFIRGAGSQQTLVLVDGIRVNSPTWGGFDFADLQALNIERIEVLRGPQSPLYGSESMGGVIQIITRRETEGVKGFFRAEGGSLGHRRTSLQVAGGGKAFDVSLALDRLETRGVSAADEDAGNREKDPYENTTVSLRVGKKVFREGRLNLTVRRYTGDVSVDGFTFGIGPTDDPNATQTRHALTAVLEFRSPVLEGWEQTVRLGVHDDDLDGDDPDTPFNNFTINTRLTEFHWQSDLVPLEGHRVTLGFEVEKREAVNRGSFDEALYIRSWLAQDRIEVDDRLTVLLGLRHDRHDEFGSKTTWRATASYRLGGGRTRLHGSLGTAFRAPNFNELYFPGFGNPDLDPETGIGGDLGIEHLFLDGRLLADLTYFDNRFEDLIGFVYPAGFVNIVRARARGFELSASFQPGQGWLLKGSYTYTRSEDETTGEPLDRRPKHRATVSVLFPPARGWTAALSLVVVRDRTDSGGTVKMDDYERVDATLNYRIRDSVKVYARIENLLDEKYNEVEGYTTPGFTGYLGTEILLK